MLWQIEFIGSFNTVEQWEQQLFHLGVESVGYAPVDGESDYQYQPGAAPHWHTCCVSLIIKNEETFHTFLLSVQTGVFAELDRDALNIRQIDETHWRDQWQQYWKPQRFGNLFITSHNAEQQPKKPEDIAVYINPGLAFGTGTHETTALCLQWLSTHSCNGRRVLDFGCGSGILSLAAVAMGSQQVTAYDHDNQALLATASNAELNEMKPRIDIVGSEAKLLTMPSFDIILANIMLTPLVELVHLFHQLLAGGGVLIVSGVLKTQKTALLATYQEYFITADYQQKNEWLMVSFCHGN